MSWRFGRSVLLGSRWYIAGQLVKYLPRKLSLDDQARLDAMRRLGLIKEEEQDG